MDGRKKLMAPIIGAMIIMSMTGVLAVWSSIATSTFQVTVNGYTQDLLSYDLEFSDLTMSAKDDGNATSQIVGLTVGETINASVGIIENVTNAAPGECSYNNDCVGIVTVDGTTITNGQTILLQAGTRDVKYELDCEAYACPNNRLVTVSFTAQ